MRRLKFNILSVDVRPTVMAKMANFQIGVDIITCPSR